MSDNLTYNNKLVAFQNNTKQITTIVYDASNNLYDLTGYTGYLYAKKYPIRANSPIDVSISATSISPTDGALLFEFNTNNLDAGDYIYEVIIDDGITNRHTVVQDTIHINSSIRN